MSTVSLSAVPAPPGFQVIEIDFDNFEINPRPAQPVIGFVIIFQHWENWEGFCVKVMTTTDLYDADTGHALIWPDGTIHLDSHGYEQQFASLGELQTFLILQEDQLEAELEEDEMEEQKRKRQRTQRRKKPKAGKARAK